MPTERSLHLVNETTRCLAIERLERRLPYAIGDALLSVEAGDWQVGNNSPEITVVGGLTSTPPDAAVARLTDGTQVLLVTNNTSSGVEVIARRYSAAGAPIGPSAILTVLPLSREPTPPAGLSIVSLPADEYLVLINYQSQLYRLHVSNSGETLGGLESITDTSLEVGYELDSILLPDGDILVAFSDAFSSAILLTRINATTLQSSAVQELVSYSDRTIYGVDLQRQDANQLVAVWTTSPMAGATLGSTGGAGFESAYRVLDASGLPLGAMGTLDTSAYVTPPEIARLASGKWLVGGMYANQDGPSSVLEVRDKFGITQWTLPLADALSSAWLAPSITIADDGQAAVTFARSTTEGLAYFLQWVNTEGTPLGFPVPINPTANSFFPAVLSVALPAQRVAVYWVGTAIDGVSATINQRVIQESQLPISVGWQAGDETFDPAMHKVVIAGLSLDMGLSQGSYKPDGTWHLELDQLQDLRLVGYAQPRPIALHTTLVEQALGSKLAETHSLTGTTADDLLPLVPSPGTIDGRQDFDRLIIDRPLTDFEWIDGSESIVHVLDRMTGEPITIANVEVFQLGEAEVSWTTLGEQIQALVDNTDGDNTDGDNTGGDNNTPPPPPPWPPGTPPPYTPPTSLSDWTDNDYFNMISNDGSAASVIGMLQDSFYSMPAAYQMPAQDAMDLYEDMLMMERESSEDTHLSQRQTSSQRQPQEPMTGNADSSSEYRSMPTMISVRTNDHPASTPHASSATVGEMLASSAGTPVALNGTAAAAAAAAIDGRGPDGNTKESTSDTAPSHRPHELASVAPPATRAAAELMSTPVVHQSAVTPEYRSQLTSQGTASPTTPVVETQIAGPPPPPSSPTRITQDDVVIAASFDTEPIFSDTDEVAKDLEEDAAAVELVVGSAVVIATGFSMANMAWMLRGSVLITKTLASLPIWVGFDPLPLLETHRIRVDSDDSLPDESLLDIVSSQRTASPV